MLNDQMPSWQQLVDWIEGKLSPQDAARTAQQVERADEATKADVAWLRAFLRAGQEIVMEEPPGTLRAQLLARFDEFARSQVADEAVADLSSGRSNLVQRLLAVLTFDSGLQPGLAGARAGDAMDQRQLIYSTNVLDVSMSIRREAGGLHVEGQILPIQDLLLEALRARIHRQDEIVAGVPVDAHGLFSFIDIRPDTYDLSIRSEELEIWIESVSLLV